MLGKILSGWGLCLALFVGSGQVAAQQGNVIKIGQSTQLSGPLASLGTEFRDGALAYFSLVNSKGGVHGRRIELITLDDAYVVEKTVENTRRLLGEENVLALFGISGTANYAAVMPLIDERGVPSIAPFNGSDDLRAAKSPHTFWLRASYGDETEKIIDQLTTLGVTRIAVFYQNDAFGKAGLNGVEAAMKKRKLTVHALGVYDKTKNDVSDAVKAIHASNAQAVVMISTYKPTAAFVKQMRLAGNVPQFFALSVVGYKALQTELGPEAAGVAIAQVMPYPWSGATPLVREFELVPKEMMPKAGITYTTFEGFIAAKVLVEGLRRAGAQLSREKLLTALESMRLYDAGGFSVAYGPGDHLGSRFSEVTIVGNSGRLMR